MVREIAGQRSWPLYIFGATGRGKSFLAALLYCRWSGHHATFVRYVDLVDQAMKASSQHQAGPWEMVKDRSLLVVDEIGVGASNEWRTEIMWKLLELRNGKPLILTGNLEPKELAGHFDARIQSRLAGGSFLEVGGRDQRTDGLPKRVHRVGEVSPR
ncbi:DnaA ATPase domain-containing protein [Schlesneria sp.]|uniref:DnaA ATPase domain-containing protein n=1 Tax=Schlesneria sp. TaxID=2762018 RepID=UPI002F20B179